MESIISWLLGEAGSHFRNCFLAGDFTEPVHQGGFVPPVGVICGAQEDSAP